MKNIIILLIFCFTCNSCLHAQTIQQSEVYNHIGREFRLPQHILEAGKGLVPTNFIYYLEFDLDKNNGIVGIKFESLPDTLMNKEVKKVTDDTKGMKLEINRHKKTKVAIPLMIMYASESRLRPKNKPITLTSSPRSYTGNVILLPPIIIYYGKGESIIN